ncbi:methionyl-tRNA formyltransferase [Clostridium grantii]|uniref:Methionyl-tRNA formyltransferase n=1 Tax=Clostridium grantii DSM 8605 TaxID=1121316 RepID=A0A1M5QUD1_9CLOT|nr:methionyl-tRNA formyltransferase [Clostridium grantii]SHH17319.1 methionyl-tRNA formyltransferase [Clostridium grantii DSM 8605]
MNIVFMGTPEFAVPSLKILIKNFNVIGVFTQPDKPKGRGNKVTISPIKEVALENNIKVYQPKSLRKDTEIIQELKDLDPDYIIVVAYGQILSKEVLNIPKYACINLHASLLPKYRGAAPINWAIINGETVSGNTSMLMDVGLDTGDMLLKQQVDIEENMTAGELHDILKDIGGELLIKTIEGYSKKEIKSIKQEDSETCYASMLDKKLAKINWEKSAKEIHDLIRGLNPWPVSYTEYKEQIMKIYSSKTLDKTSEKEAGTILKVNDEGIEVSCGEKVILLTSIQFPGKKVLLVKDYLRGNTIEEGYVLK